MCFSPTAGREGLTCPDESREMSMLKIAVAAAAVAATVTFVSSAPSQAGGGKRGQSCQATCQAKGLTPQQTNICTNKCEAKRDGRAR